MPSYRPHPLTAPPDAPPPPLWIVATTTWHRPTCFVVWRGAAWGWRTVPIFVSETWARLSGATTVTRLIERGLN